MEKQADRIARHDREIKELDERSKRIGKELRDNTIRARESWAGHIESSVEIKMINKLIENIKSTNRWIVGIFITLLLALFGYFAILIIILLKANILGA